MPRLPPVPGRPCLHCLPPVPLSLTLLLLARMYKKRIAAYRHMFETLGGDPKSGNPA